MTKPKSPRTLSKSRFKSALECPTKLFYYGKKKEYANQMAENEFKPECLIASDSSDVPGIISGYVYEDPETGEYVDIEGELEQSTTSGTDIDFYVNTKNGLDYCDDFCDMRDEMTEQDLDPESEDDVRKYLKDKYGAE